MLPSPIEVFEVRIEQSASIVFNGFAQILAIKTFYTLDNYWKKTIGQVPFGNTFLLWITRLSFTLLFPSSFILPSLETSSCFFLL